MNNNKTRWASMINCAKQYLLACGYIDTVTLKKIGFCDAGIIALRQIDPDMAFLSIGKNIDKVIFYRSGYCTCDNCGDVSVLICDDIAQCSECKSMQVENKETSEFFARLAMKRMHNRKKCTIGNLSDGLICGEIDLVINSIENSWVDGDQLFVYSEKEQEEINALFNEKIALEDEKRSKRNEARPV